MSIKEWAEREVELAKRRERGEKPADEWDYGCACYDSALKAFRSLCDDGHSGMSIGFAKIILNRLIDGKPLTPIEDTPDGWNDITGKQDQYISYQSRRMSALFKTVYSDGRVEYRDVDRFMGVDAGSGVGFHSGLCTLIGQEMYPITMPYMPEDKPYKVYCEDCLAYPENGDFDTVAVFRIVTPEGESRKICRYFREPCEGEGTVYNGWVEIGREEYEQRKEMHRKRIAGSKEGK